MTTVVLTILFQQNWNNKNGYINNDAKGYYAYLPASIIHQDLSLKQIKDKAWYHQTEEGKVFIKYTSGNALCYLPGFLLAHGVAKMSSYAADGYSLPYQLSLVATALFFIIMSLRLCTQLLHQHFKDYVVGLSILTIFIGTNYYYYSSSIFLSYSHIYSFYFILLFLKYSIKSMEEYSFRNALILGFSMGMMTLIRPVDGVFLLFPILYHVKSYKDLNERFIYIVHQYKALLLSTVIALLVWTPQLLYNYYVFGEITINGYRDESFFFTDPELWNLLFSFNNGWLIYSPLMVLSLLGLILLALRKQRWWAFICALYLLVISSWWCWWYVGFGNRAAINLSAFLIFPLAYLLDLCLKRKILKLIVPVVVALGIALNIFQTRQFERGNIRSEAMTFKAFKTAWLNNDIKFEFFDQLEKLDSDLALKGINAVHTWVYDTIDIYNALHSDSLKLDNEKMYLGNYKYPIKRANTFIAEAVISNPTKGVSLYGKLITKENCKTDEYGGTSISKTSDGNYKLRNYYRYKDEIMECADSIHFFIYNTLLEETKILDLKIYTLRAQDTLIYLE